MIINPATIQRSDGKVTVSATIESSFGRGELWYRFEDAFAPYVTIDTLDAFVVALLYPAMKSGESIEIRGPISEKLFHALSRQYMRLVQVVRPDCSVIELHPRELVAFPHAPTASGVITGFSGGVDSFCTIHDYFSHAPSPSYRLTHVIFTNVGSHGDDPVRSERLFRERLDLLRAYPDAAGLDLITVDSNLREWTRSLPYVDVHVPSNVSCALLLQNLIQRYLYSSAYQHKTCYAGLVDDISLFDAPGIPMLSTERLDCVSVGSEYTRVEKTARVATLPESVRYLNVCVREGANCSECEKCCRTLFTLELLGQIDQFGQIFDLGKYRRAKDNYLRSLAENPFKPLNFEILNFMAERGIKLPFELRCRNWVARQRHWMTTAPW